MSFNVVDIIALAILALGLIKGWRAGLIIMAGNIASLIVGLVVSTYIFSWLSATSLLSGVVSSQPIISIIIYLVVLSIVTKLLRLIFVLIDKVWKIIALLPLIGLVNRALGSVIGLAESFVFLILLTYLTQNFLVNILSSSMLATINASLSYGYLSVIVAHIQFLIPSINL